MTAGARAFIRALGRYAVESVRGGCGERPEGARCAACVHFHDDPDFVEAVTPGLASMSSGRASVRSRDGICTQHGRHLSGDAYCEQFLALGHGLGRLFLR